MKGRLKVGIFIDDKSGLPHVNELIHWMSLQSTIEVTLLIVNSTESSEYTWSKSKGLDDSSISESKSTLDGIVWTALLRLDRRRLLNSKAYAALVASINVVEAERRNIEIRRLGAHAGNAAPLSEADLTLIKLEQFDLLVQCGPSNGTDEAATCARLGMIDISFGDERILCGEPAGFWETLLGQDKTGFSIRHLGHDQRSWRVIVAGSFPTQAYYLLNRAALLVRSVRHLKLLLTRVALSGELPEAARSSPSGGMSLDYPRTLDGIRYICVILARALTAKARALVGLEERWGVSFTDRNWQDAVLGRGRQVENPKGRFFADPFLISVKDETFCFVEDYIDSKGKGVVSVLKMGSEKASLIGQAIEEDFHLSFPYVFEYENQLFMCPESHQAGQIRIYRCAEFPLKWELHSIAMEGVSAVDTMIFSSNGRWWMLTNIDSIAGAETFSELHLFSALTPVGAEWIAHSMNPLIVDPEFARNAGLLRNGAEIFRVSQARAFGAYGVSASISEIKKMDDADYHEELVTTLRPTFERGLSGLHHFHSAGGYSVWDHKRRERPR